MCLIIVDVFPHSHQQTRTPTGTEYIWTGDRWQQAPDGIKGHDPQFWVGYRLHFQEREIEKQLPTHPPTIHTYIHTHTYTFVSFSTHNFDAHL